MEDLSTELFDILKFLLPGFLTAWIFYAFTSYPKPSQFERIVQALIFVVFIQGMVFCIKHILFYLGQSWSLGAWTQDVSTVWSYAAAIILGFVFSLFANNDLFHSFMRWANFTKQSSYHCEWFGAFNTCPVHVILHLEDDRRVFGWPQEWPSQPEKGHFLLRNPSWISEKGDYIDMPTVKFMLLKSSDIKWVEFLQDNPEVEYVQKSTDATAVHNPAE